MSVRERNESIKICHAGEKQQKVLDVHYELQNMHQKKKAEVEVAAFILQPQLRPVNY